MIVKIRLKIALWRSPLKIAWCDQVQVAPDDNNKIVFKKGNPQASIVSIPLGGQTDPNSIVGFILEWKKSSKKSEEKHNFRSNK